MHNTPNLDKKLLQLQEQIKLVANKSNPAFRGAAYADINQTHEAVLPVLRDWGIIVVHQGEFRGGVFGVLTNIRDVESQEYVNSFFPIPQGKMEGGWHKQYDKATKTTTEVHTPEVVMPINMHGIGGLFTYGARYNLRALLCLAQEDDDGNAASGVSTSNKGGDETPW